MGSFQNFSDTPNSIIKEGEEITITFTRNGDGTGTIKWNIPAPINGCDPAAQAYNGILITIDTKAANYTTTSPKNGKRYMGDPTADPDMHAGDKLDTALVEAVFYDDKKTTSLTVTDIDPNKFYYVSGYAVDNVGTYHTQGVHAYSLPTGEAENPQVEYNAYQDISLLSTDSSKITLGTLTGLDKTKTYDFYIKIDNVDYHLPIQGSEAQSYNDLINALNKQFKLITGVSGFGSCGEKPPANAKPPYIGPLPPNANTWYVDIPNQQVYFFDGTNNLPKDAVFTDTDPSLKTPGTWWYNPTEPKTIKQYDSSLGWVTKDMINLDHDPTKPYCGELWFNQTEVYEFNGDHWCKLCLYIQNRNPSLPIIFDCNAYWYDTVNGTFQKWDFAEEKWVDALAIVSKKDPTTLTVGDFWLNETDGKMYQFYAGIWNLMQNVRYDAPNASGNIDDIAPNTYWLNPQNQIFYKRDNANTTWTATDYTMYPSDPRDPGSCSLWLKEDGPLYTLYSRDIVTNPSWKQVTEFYQQAIDPSLAPNLPPCAVWYNPDDGTLKYIMGNSCENKGYIDSDFDPLHPPVGSVWHDTKNNKFYVWDGLAWDEIHPIVSKFDPFNITTGYLWFDTTNNLLKQWNGTTWNILPYTTKNPKPIQGTLWYNTVNDELYIWDGSSWVVYQPIVFVQLKYQVDKHDPNVDGRAYLFFLFSIAGCCHSIEIIPSTGSLIASLKQGVIYHEPKLGGNGPASGPMYKQLGVGTDGTPDERRELQAKIRAMMGSMGTTVELTKEQLNYAIDNALLQFRKYSSYAYTRNFFFLDLKPNQQTYVLANNCVGFNKITNIRALYRMQAGWIRTGLAGNELFGVAALQQLYTVGTFDMLSFSLMSQYMKELEQLFASRIMHQWVESTRELRLYQRIVLPERVLVDATIERTEQDILTNRVSAMWVFSWAMAEAKLILWQVRGKYLNLPGPNGSTSLNGQDLKSSGEDDKQKLMDELFDPAMGNYEDVGLAGHFTIG